MGGQFTQQRVARISRSGGVVDGVFQLATMWLCAVVVDSIFCSMCFAAITASNSTRACVRVEPLSRLLTMLQKVYIRHVNTLFELLLLH